jgi:hypothetical protein
MPRTPYMETEALLAVLEDRGADAYAILRKMHAHELRTFREQLERLVDLTLEAGTIALVDGPQVTP